MSSNSESASIDNKEIEIDSVSGNSKNFEVQHENKRLQDVIQGI
jgi:hypothetical protein